MRYAIMTALLVFGAALQAAEDLIWVEAENAEPRQLFRNPWYMDIEEAAVSGGQWLGSFSEAQQPSGTGTVAFDVAQAGEYRLWLRMDTRGTGLLYRIDGGDWVDVDVKAKKKEDADNRRNEDYVRQVVDERPVSADGTHGSKYLAWVREREVDLARGQHSIEFVLGGREGEKRYGAVDCFVLAGGDFTPNAKFKPGEDWPADMVVSFGEGESWAFEPERDPLTDDALVDLRYLNEDVAGATGFVRRSEDGNDFVRGDGRPIRFWGGSEYYQRGGWGEVERALTRIESEKERVERARNDGNEALVNRLNEGLKQREEEVVQLREEAYRNLQHHAEFLAKRGVNIVRLHGHMPARTGRRDTEKKPFHAVDAEALDQAHRLVACMKEAGIYTIISPYWGSHTDIEEHWDVPDSRTGTLAGLVFFVPEVQEAYKAWIKTLYTTPNPYTGIPLKDDASVAIIQLQNEDSMLFWTMQRVGGEARAILERQFASWLKEKYGSFDKVREAWQGAEHARDDWDGGRVGTDIVWFFSSAARDEGQWADPGKQQRLSDQLEFIARTMYNFNSMIGAYLREELGCRQLVNAGNWKTVDPVTAGDVERWSYTANEVIAKNHYFGGQHKGLNTGYQILAGQVFTNRSAADHPTALPLNVKQVVGYPFIIPESLWVPPNRYQAEGPLMVAAQQSLTGLDCFFWFCNGQMEWQPPGNKWTYSTPMQLGQFPAAALTWRTGMLAQGDPVVVEHRSLDDLWQRKTPIIAEGASWDPNRDQGDMPEESAVKVGVDPKAFCVGPVQVVYGSDSSRSVARDLAPYIDEDEQVIHSVTGQVEWRYGEGLYKVRAPKVQGAAGFLGKAGKVDLGDVAVEIGNDYGSVVVVAMDDRPLKESGKVLVQVGTTCRPTGWKARECTFKANDEPIEGFRILNVGGSPWQIENAMGTVSIANAGLTRAVLLDPNGMPTDTPVKLQKAAGMTTVELPPNTLYLVLTR